MKKITKADIVQAFYDLHYKYDHNKITIKLLSEKSGYSRTTIYNYFKTKEELFDYIYTLEEATMIGVDFQNKTARENALIFCDELEEYRPIIKRFTEQPSVVNSWQKMCTNTILKQENISSKLLASSIASAINGAVIEYARDDLIKLEELIDVIATIIEPYIKK